MIIEFDGYGINEYVAGQCVSITKLKRMYLNVKHEGISNGGVIDLFCVRHNYDHIPCSFCKDFISEIVINLDTDYIYLPNSISLSLSFAFVYRTFLPST
ncbi:MULTISPECIES: hypothetical protein [Bacillus cereus group]|uniref:hypothetical protein n=1 Tax=Bacillus cereus group TaxID=86661 RepID=UPI00202CE5F1|nr:hypothetical protein [Bacillus cereus group sp. BcHK114]MCM0004047.1 hypothetical protein [Bacillus paranthracis]MDA1954623.1 hypothetical protein [Bacillus cereus group sp. BcHK114]